MNPRERIQDYRERLNQEIENLNRERENINNARNDVRGNVTANENLDRDEARVNNLINTANFRLEELATAERIVGTMSSLEDLYRQAIEGVSDPQLQADIEDLENRLTDLHELDPDNVVNEVWNEIGGKPEVPTRESVEARMSTSSITTDATDSSGDSNPTDPPEEEMTSVDLNQEVIAEERPEVSDNPDVVAAAEEEEQELSESNLPDEINAEYFNIYVSKITEAMDRKEVLEREIAELTEARRNEPAQVKVEEMAALIQEKTEQLQEFNEMTANNLVTCQGEMMRYRELLMEEKINKAKETEDKKQVLQDRYKKMMERYMDSVIRGEEPKMSAEQIEQSFKNSMKNLNDDQIAYDDSTNKELQGLANKEQILREYASKLGVNLANVTPIRYDEVTPSITEEEIKDAMKEAEEDMKVDLGGTPQGTNPDEMNPEDLTPEELERIQQGLEEGLDGLDNPEMDPENPDIDPEGMDIVEEDPSIDEIEEEIEKTNDPQKLSLLNKALLAAGGFAVGVGLSCVPGVGTIRMAVAGVKLGASAINAWAKGHPNGRVANMINGFKEKHPKITAGIQKIHEKTHSEPLNVFINGMAAGYIAGNVFEMVTGNTVAEAVADKFRTPTPEVPVPTPTPTDPSIGADSPSPVVPEPATVETLVNTTPELPEMIPGASYDLSGISRGLISSDSNNFLDLITQAGQNATFDREVIHNGQRMWHFLQENGKGYAWFPAEVVEEALGKQAAEIISSGMTLGG